MKPARLTKKLFLSLASVALAFGLLEAGLRIAGFQHRTVEVPIRIWNRLQDEEMEEGKALHHVDAYSLWAPRPGAGVDWGKGETINAAGFRGPLYETERTPGSLRVATLGDSSTFGMGVAYSDCYSAQLERLLSENGSPVEVLDGGVIGFTCRQGLERYKSLVRSYRPDVVIAAFGAVNEHYPCNSLPDAPKIARSQRQVTRFGKLRASLREKLRVMHLYSWLVLESQGGLEGLRARWDAQNKLLNADREGAKNADWEGLRRVPLSDFDLALTELANAVDADGARLVLVCMPRDPAAEKQRPVLPLYSAKVLEVARREGLQVADVRALFHGEFDRGRKPKELFLPGDFWHPNPTGHELVAETLVPLVLDESAGRLEPER